jgi:hypothetical protein
MQGCLCLQGCACTQGWLNVYRCHQHVYWYSTTGCWLLHGICCLSNYWCVSVQPVNLSAERQPVPTLLPVAVLKPIGSMALFNLAQPLLHAAPGFRA